MKLESSAGVRAVGQDVAEESRPWRRSIQRVSASSRCVAISHARGSRVGAVFIDSSMRVLAQRR